MKLRIGLFAIFLLTSSLSAQTKVYLTPLYAKSDSEMVAITDNSTDADEDYMKTILGKKFRGLMEAILERGYSPNDFSGSITDAYTAAADSSGFLIIPASYSTDSSVTYTTAPIMDFRSGVLKVTPLNFFFRMDAAPAPSAGQVFLDTTITGHQHLPVYGDGNGDDHFLLSMPIANLTTTDGYGITYSATNDDLRFAAITWALFSSDYANVDSIADNISAATRILVINDTVGTVTSKTIDIPVYFTQTGMITANTGDTLTFTGGFIDAAPEQKIFNDNGGEIRMPGYHIHVKWFGAVGDGVTEDHTAIQWAADALRGESNANITRGTWGTLDFPKGKFIVNPTNHLEFLPDSARTLHIVGQGDGTIFTNRDFASYGDLFGDTYVASGKPVQGEVRFAYFRIDSTHQGDSDGTGGVNAFGIVMSDAIIEHVKINRAGNRAIAFEGYDDGYTGTGNGFGNVTLRYLEIKNSWKNAISINKHDSARIEYVNLEKIYIDGWSMAVVDSPGQAANTNATGVNLLARQTTGDNPGHTFSITDLIIKNGHSTAIEINGLNSDNQFYGKNWSITDTNVDSATTPAAVLITEAWGGYVDGLTIRNTVGGPAWRDRTGNGNWHITNAIIDSTTTGQAVGYAFDLFGTSGYMITNSRILDNARGIFANNTSAVPWAWFTDCHIRGDSLGYYTYEYNLEDVFSVTGSRIEYTQDAYTTAGLNIAYNGYFAADSHNVKDFDSNGIPDGWEIYFPYNEVYRDSLITYLDADSGLVIENMASQQLDFVLRQNVSARLSGSDTYTVNMMTLDDQGNTLRQWVNAGSVGGAILTGTYQQTGQSVTSYVGVGRTGATKMAANSRLVVKWIECIVE